MGVLDKILTDVQGIVIDSEFESWKGFLEIISPTLLILWERRLMDSQRGKSTCSKFHCKLLVELRLGPRPFYFQTECISYLLICEELPQNLTA